MNWIGGSRNRRMLQSDVRKQREFFEKKKLEKRKENLGLAVDSHGAASGRPSTDLIRLFIVNQIAAKKENKNGHKATHLSQRKKVARWPIHHNTLELPMSPCSPSRLSLMESQPQYCAQRKRRNLSERNNSRQLSPVLESNMSDGSASDYRHIISETFSPSSSATREREEFKPSSQPREVREANPWPAMSCRSQLKAHYPPVSRVQFGSAESSVISTPKSRRHALKTAECFVSLSNEEKDQETALVDFDSGEYSGRETTYDNRQIRISFPEESPQSSLSIGDPNEYHSRHHETDFRSQSAPCGGRDQGSVKSSGSVCSSPSEGLFSSSSDSVGSRGGEGDQFVPSHLQPSKGQERDTRTGQEIHPYERREMGTQTDSLSACFTSEASTQCSLLREGGVSTSPGSSAGFQSYSRQFWHGKNDEATRGWRVSADELLGVDSHTGTPNSPREEAPLPQSKSGAAAQNTRAASTGQQLLSGGPENLCPPKTLPENRSLSTPTLKHICLKKTPVRDEFRMEPNGGLRQVKQVEPYDQLTHPAENMARREDESISESTLMNEVSEESATLQEIADILLTMKQKK